MVMPAYFTYMIPVTTGNPTQIVQDNLHLVSKFVRKLIRSLICIHVFLLLSNLYSPLDMHSLCGYVSVNYFRRERKTSTIEFYLLTLKVWWSFLFSCFKDISFSDWKWRDNASEIKKKMYVLRLFFTGCLLVMFHVNSPEVIFIYCNY